MLSTVLMMPLVRLIGAEDKVVGFQGGIAVLSVIAFMMLAFCCDGGIEHLAVKAEIRRAVSEHADDTERERAKDNPWPEFAPAAARTVGEQPHAVHGAARRPYAQPLGQIPAMDYLWRAPIRYRLRARLQHAGSQP